MKQQKHTALISTWVFHFHCEPGLYIFKELFKAAVSSIQKRGSQQQLKRALHMQSVSMLFILHFEEATPCIRTKEQP